MLLPILAFGFAMAGDVEAADVRPTAVDVHASVCLSDGQILAGARILDMQATVYLELEDAFVGIPRSAWAPDCPPLSAFEGDRSALRAFALPGPQRLVATPLQLADRSIVALLDGQTLSLPETLWLDVTPLAKDDPLYKALAPSRQGHSGAAGGLAVAAIVVAVGVGLAVVVVVALSGLGPIEFN